MSNYNSVNDFHKNVFRLKKKINAGMAKEIHLAKWNGNTLVYSIPNKNNPERLADFQGPSKIFSYSYPSFQHHHFTYPDDPEILEVFVGWGNLSI